MKCLRISSDTDSSFNNWEIDHLYLMVQIISLAANHFGAKSTNIWVGRESKYIFVQVVGIIQYSLRDGQMIK